MIEVALLSDLTSVLSGLNIAEFFETLDFTPHLSTLLLDAFGLVAQLVLLSHQITDADTLGVILRVAGSEFTVLLVEEDAVAARFVVQVTVFASFLLEEVF